MKARELFVAGLGVLLPACAAMAQEVQFPRTVTAGSAFSVPTSGSGKVTLYIVGPAQALRREVQLGSAVSFAAGELYGAGHYIAATSDGAEAGEFDVVPASAVGSLGFLAKPSRLPVNIHNGISGAVYVFDLYHNLITTSMPATLELAGAAGEKQTRNVTTHNGLAWTTMDSAAKESAARFTARVGDVSSTRIISQVPGDPCSISISAKPTGNRLQVQTAPVRDCNGNMIPDGTIVTFTEASGSSQSTVDVPLKQGIASVVMPANRGAKISAASGVVAGNEIRWTVADDKPIVALSCALLLPALSFAQDEPSVRVEPPQLQGSRALEGQTANSVIKDYLQSWKGLHDAMDGNDPARLDPDFIGAARDKLAETIASQARSGIHTRYQDRSHDLQIVFYSPEGLSIQMTDTVDYEEQVLEKDKVLATKVIHQRYLIVLTPSEVRWQVRIFQAKPS